MYNIELSKEELSFITQVLGQLPTQTNAHPLYVKVAQYLQPQASSNEVEIVEE